MLFALKKSIDRSAGVSPFTRFGPGAGITVEAKESTLKNRLA